MTMTTTSLGKLAGRIDEGGILSFRGIPFAAPPVGLLRWAAPQPPLAWAGTRDATEFGPAAPQAESAMAPLLGFDIQRQDEDCLTLNVWTPATSGARPVMVFFHGGAWVIGSSSQSCYNGARLAKRGDAVIVTVNYRLGAFGFLRGLDVCGDTFPSSGNEGILDCIAALHWVREEIAVFGGDPANVTIFGESAGSGNCAALLVAPEAKGLFHKAICQSGALNLLTSPAPASDKVRKILADQVLDPGDAAKLRSLTWQELQVVQNRATPRGREVPYAPVLDGGVLPAAPHLALREGVAAGVPLLLGTNLNEMKLYALGDPSLQDLTEERLLDRVESLGPGRDVDAAEVVSRYREARAARGEAVTPAELWLAISTDHTFRWGAMHLASLQSRVAPVFAYLFTRHSPAFDGRLGAAHATDLPFVFGTTDDPGMGRLAGSGPEVDRLSATMMDAWLAFARSGNPSTAALPWPRYEESRRTTMLLGDACGAQDAPYEVERACWEPDPRY